MSQGTVNNASIHDTSQFRADLKDDLAGLRLTGSQKREFVKGVLKQRGGGLNAREVRKTVSKMEITDSQKKKLLSKFKAKKGGFF